MRRWNRRFGPLLLVLVLVIMFPVLAQGQSEATPPEGSAPAAAPVFSARPAEGDDLGPFRFELAAGSSAESTLVVLNHAEDLAELQSFAVDITTAANGGYLVVPERSTSDTVSTWISMNSDPDSVEAGGEVAIEISVAVPPGTAAGEYMAAIATETTSSFAMEGTDVLRQVSRKVNAVVITVPGPVHVAFEIGNPVIETIDGVSRLTVPIENTGNTRVRPAGVIEIRSAQGEIVASVIVTMDSVYAWHGTVIAANISPEVPAGTYVVTMELADAASGAAASFSGAVTVPESSS